MSALSHPISSCRADHVTCFGCGTRWRAENAPHTSRCPRCDWPLITRTWRTEPIRASTRALFARDQRPQDPAKLAPVAR